MNIGLYQSASSIRALERWQDAVAQNITSGSIIGYKRRTVEVEADFAGALQTTPGQDVSRGEGAPGWFPRSTLGVSYLRGETRPTGMDLDIAIDGEGFFEVQGSDGSVLYTRAGEFRLSEDRRLVNSAGLEVRNQDGNPMVLPQGAGGPSISAEGIVSVGATPVGRLAITTFADTSKLRPSGSNLFLAPEGLEAVPVERPTLIPRSIEQSNISPMREMIDLVTISRAYESNQKVLQTRDQLLGRTIETLG